MLYEKTAATTDRYHQLGGKIKAAEKCMAEIAVLRTHIVNSAKAREEMRELLAVKTIIDQIMGCDGRGSAQEKEHASGELTVLF